jgi:hypothetical protein
MVLGLRSSEREKERIREKERELERAYLNLHRTPDKTGEILQIKQTDPSPPTQATAA